jgi:hypothetical protein
VGEISRLYLRVSLISSFLFRPFRKGDVTFAHVTQTYVIAVGINSVVFDMVLPCYCFAISLLRGPACRRNSPESLGRPSVATTTSCRTLSKWSGCNPRSSDRRTCQVVAPRSHGSRLTCAWPASSRFRLQVSWFVVWTLSSDSALEMCRTCPVMAAGGTLELMLCTYIYLLAKPFTYFQAGVCTPWISSLDVLQIFLLPDLSMVQS